MITFEILRDNCRHQGMIKDGKKWCGHNAKCWDDWKVCKQKTCPLLHPQKNEQSDDIEGQMTLEEYLRMEVSEHK